MTKIQIKNYFKSVGGYTLIELLAVIIIFVIIGSIIAGILYASLRGVTKARINDVVAQNGNFALSNITDAINSSDKIVVGSCGVDPTSLTSIGLRRIDGSVVVFECSNDKIVIKNYVSFPPSPTPAPLPLSVVSLIDSTQVKTYDPGVGSACYFKCYQNNVYSVPKIEIGFSLSQAGGTFFETKSNASFKTTQSLRNYNAK